MNSNINQLIVSAIGASNTIIQQQKSQISDSVLNIDTLNKTISTVNGEKAIL